MQQESFSREEADAFYKDLHQRIRDLRKGPSTRVPKTRQLQKAAIEIKEAKLALKREYEEDKKNFGLNTRTLFTSCNALPVP